MRRDAATARCCRYATHAASSYRYAASLCPIRDMLMLAAAIIFHAITLLRRAMLFFFRFH